MTRRDSFQSRGPPSAKVRTRLCVPSRLGRLKRLERLNMASDGCGRLCVAATCAIHPTKREMGNKMASLAPCFRFIFLSNRGGRFFEATPAAALVGRVRTAGTWGLVDFLLDPSHPSHPLLCTPPPMPCTLVPGAASLQSRSTAHGIAERDDRAQCPSRESAGASGLAPRRPSVAYDSGHGLPPRISITSLPSPRRSRLSIPRHRLLIPQTIAFVWRGLVDIPDHLVSLSHYPHLHTWSRPPSHSSRSSLTRYTNL